MQLRIIALVVLTSLSACKSTQKPAVETSNVASNTIETQKQKPSIDSSKLNVKNIIIQHHIPYSEHSVVASNIKNECHQLGSQFSNSLTKYAKKYNLKLTQVSSALPKKGNTIKLTIDNVFSSGNAFIGHRKSATVTAQLFVDGKMVSETQRTRNSAGGFMGGFKGSCSVLAHTVNTLGNDIAKWLIKKA